VTPSRAARFAAAYAALYAAHDLADHVLGQSDKQAKHKGDPGPAGYRALAGHVGAYHAVQVAAVLLLRALDVRPGWRRTAAAVAWSAGTHALLDRRWPVRYILEITRSPGFATELSPVCGPYVADQALHHACLTLSAAVLAAAE
jgi:hypothetical protein